MDSPGRFAQKFKAAVERNFDDSVQMYDAFEERYRLFARVAEGLAVLAPEITPAAILDVGCGSGASTAVLLRLYPTAARIVAVDISKTMLARARSRLPTDSRLFFYRADAERLDGFPEKNFDAVFYNASIFLIPDFKKSLTQAARLLVPRGAIFLSFYAGFRDDTDSDVITAASPGLHYRYGAVPEEDLITFLQQMPGFRLCSRQMLVEADPGFLYDFLAIPAQSAGLFPKISYTERLPKIREICLRVGEQGRPIRMAWTLAVARHDLT